MELLAASALANCHTLFAHQWLVESTEDFKLRIAAMLHEKPEHVAPAHSDRTRCFIVASLFCLVERDLGRNRHKGANNN